MKEYSKTFCIYPWIHQQATPPGKINYCCISMHSSISDDDGVEFSLAKNSFQEAWNVQDMKDLRKKMIRGQKIQGCQTCYKQEAMGKRSYRQSHNKEWFDRLGVESFSNLVENSIEREFIVESQPLCLDLRLGNLCNLKCRTCNPYNSIQIYNEWQSLDESTNKNYSKFWQKYGLEFGGCGPWYESENFWQSVEKAIPFLQKVYITGGEPVLIEGNYEFLRKCKEMGFAGNIDLFFNTNLTFLKDGFIELLNDFRSVKINASLDGHGITNEYIRPPSRWSIIDKNFRKVAKEGGENLILGISPVIQIYNVLTIADLFEYVEEISEDYGREISIDFLFCFNPKFLDIACLPENVKLEAIARLENFKRTSRTYNQKTSLSFYIKNGVDSMINYLKQNNDKEDKERIHDFMKYTKTLDQKRDQNFSENFMDLDFLLTESGYSYNDVLSIE